MLGPINPNAINPIGSQFLPAAVQYVPGGKRETTVSRVTPPKDVAGGTVHRGDER